MGSGVKEPAVGRAARDDAQRPVESALLTALRIGAEGLSQLSRREREVLVGASIDLEDKEIAALLELSYWTVRTIWQRILTKLEAPSRRHATARLLEQVLKL